MIYNKTLFLVLVFEWSRYLINVNNSYTWKSIRISIPFESRSLNNYFPWFLLIYIATLNFGFKCTMVCFHNSNMPYGLFMTSEENEKQRCKNVYAWKLLRNFVG